MECSGSGTIANTAARRYNGSMVASPHPIRALSHLLSQRTVDEQALIQALDAVHEKHPKSIALPSGRSILAEVSKKSPRAAVHWWRLRGDDAWKATRLTELPLLAVLDPKGFGEIAQDAPEHLVRLPDDAIDFLESGLKHSPIPDLILPNQEEGGHPSPKRLDGWAITLHQVLTAYCLADIPGPAQEDKTRAFFERGLMPILDATSLVEDIGKNKAFDLMTPCARECGEDISLQRKAQITPWLDMWETGSPDFFVSGPIFERIEAAGDSTRNIKRKLLERAFCDQAAGHTVTEKKSAKDTWTWMLGVMHAQPGEVIEMRKEEEPVWLQSMRAFPDLAGEIIRRPPPGGLCQPGQEAALWEEMLALHIGDNKRTSRGFTAEDAALLHKLVPFQIKMDSHGPLLWRMEIDHVAVQRAASIFLDTHQELFAGEPDGPEQAYAMGQFFDAVMRDTMETSRSAGNLAIAMHPALRPRLGPVALGALATLQAMVQREPGLLPETVSQQIIDSPPIDISNLGSDWKDQFIASLDKAANSIHFQDRDPRIEAMVFAVIDHGSLAMNTAPAANEKPRRMRI